MNEKNEAAQIAYCKAHALALQELENIRDYIENMPAPDSNTDWGHVGSMNYIASKLISVLDTDGE